MVEEICMEYPYQCKRHVAWHRLQSSLKFQSTETQKEIFDTTAYPDNVERAKTTFMPANYRRYTIAFNSDYWKQHEELGHDLASKLTDDEKQSLKFYTGHGYKDVMNFIYGRPRRVHHGFTDAEGNHHEVLVQKELDDEQYNAFMEKVVNDVNKATGLSRELEEPQILYRAMVVHDDVKQKRERMEEEEVDAFINKNFKVGDTFHRKAVTSTTEDPAVAVNFFLPEGAAHKGNGVIIEYKTKKGARIGRDFGTGGTIANEMEVLLPAETDFKVVAIHRDIKYTIDARRNGLQRGISPNKWGKIIAPKVTLIQVEEIE